ncbi:hypothetical protein FQV39_28730 [Bosea sp. F3-2]|uniref:hypothetical protein n=1 Tax=Bosea sp. F3-2 TaxID=2599640 RepID=UPI0011EEC4E8|nr:hypothetical protein [Bosea sp. F3-2]QEL26150.1 hypothetical protein FQV39_28730 [Bosea sp. F3-2]
MMLARTALRLAIVETLAPYAQIVAPDPAWPTFAGKHVYDTQISATALADVDAPVPVIVVLTDETELKADGTDVTLASSSTPQIVTVAFEIMVPVRVDEGSESVVRLVGPIDAAAEALLDLIEDQIKQRIDDGRMIGPLDRVLAEVVEIKSLPYRDPDTETRLSASRVEFSCRVLRGQRWPKDLPASPQPFDYLPSPMREVAEALPAGSYGAKIATMLGSLIGRPADFPALNEMRLAANLARGADDTPAAPADASTTPPTGDLGGSVTF